MIRPWTGTNLQEVTDGDKVAAQRLVWTARVLVGSLFDTLREGQSFRQQSIGLRNGSVIEATIWKTKQGERSLVRIHAQPGTEQPNWGGFLVLVGYVSGGETIILGDALIPTAEYLEDASSVWRTRHLVTTTEGVVQSAPIGEDLSRVWRYLSPPTQDLTTRYQYWGWMCTWWGQRNGQEAVLSWDHGGNQRYQAPSVDVYHKDLTAVTYRLALNGRNILTSNNIVPAPGGTFIVAGPDGNIALSCRDNVMGAGIVGNYCVYITTDWEFTITIFYKHIDNIFKDVEPWIKLGTYSKEFTGLPPQWTKSFFPHPWFFSPDDGSAISWTDAIEVPQWDSVENQDRPGYYYCAKLVTITFFVDDSTLQFSVAIGDIPHYNPVIDNGVGSPGPPTYSYTIDTTTDLPLAVDYNFSGEIQTLIQTDKYKLVVESGATIVSTSTSTVKFNGDIISFFGSSALSNLIDFDLRSPLFLYRKSENDLDIWYKYKAQNEIKISDSPLLYSLSDGYKQLLFTTDGNWITRGRYSDVRLLLEMRDPYSAIISVPTALTNEVGLTASADVIYRSILLHNDTVFDIDAVLTPCLPDGSDFGAKGARIFPTRVM